jgi:hypothetical protein
VVVVEVILTLHPQEDQEEGVEVHSQEEQGQLTKVLPVVQVAVPLEEEEAEVLAKQVKIVEILQTHVREVQDLFILCFLL